MSSTFTPVRRDHFPLIVDWLGQVHVRRWWHEPATPEFVEGEFGSIVDGDDKTRAFLVEDEGRPIGLVQCYLIDDYPEHAMTIGIDGAVGIDLFIGIEELTGCGRGPTIIGAFIDQIIRPGYPNSRHVVADPEVENLASVRSFEKAGFIKGAVTTGEHGPEQLMVLVLSSTAESP